VTGARLHGQGPGWCGTGAAHGDKADPDGSAPTANAGPFGSESGDSDAAHARVSSPLRLAALQCLWPLGARCQSQSQARVKQWRPREVCPVHGWVSRLCAAAVLTHVALARTHAMPGRAAHHPFSKQSVGQKVVSLLNVVPKKRSGPATAGAPCRHPKE